MTSHRATTYTVYPTGYDDFTFSDKHVWSLTVEERSPSGWAVKSMSRVLNSAGEWEYEPIPSERDDAFKERTRFYLEEALRLAESVVDAVRWNGVTADEADVQVKLRRARQAKS